MKPLLYSVLATTIISLISLVGIATLAIKDALLNKILLLLVGFSAGALMGDTFFHLIPEGLEKNPGSLFPAYILAGFCLFFILERYVHWRHCHKSGGQCREHAFTYINLFGDALHNFIDGLVIAASFVVDSRLGLATTIAVVIHEIPQEIGDFSILLYGGFSRAKALVFNFLTAITAIAGAVIGFFLVSSSLRLVNFFIAITAGGFIYIAASDLVPEIHKETKDKTVVASFLMFVLGAGLMWGMKVLIK
jgi:zinc and cadmium transporter